jgi:hypothetical protein
MPGVKQKSNKMYNKILQDAVHYKSRIKPRKILLYILCDFCCTPGIYTVKYPDDDNKSDRNMYVLTIKDKYSKFINMHFVGLNMNDRHTFLHGMELTKYLPALYVYLPLSFPNIIFIHNSHCTHSRVFAFHFIPVLNYSNNMF